MRKRNRTHCDCGQALVGEHAQHYKKDGRLYLDNRCRDCRRSRERRRYYAEKAAALAAPQSAPARPTVVYPQYRRWLKEIAAQVIR